MEYLWEMFWFLLLAPALIRRVLKISTWKLLWDQYFTRIIGVAGLLPGLDYYYKGLAAIGFFIYFFFYVFVECFFEQIYSTKYVVILDNLWEEFFYNYLVGTPSIFLGEWLVLLSIISLFFYWVLARYLNIKIKLWLINIIIAIYIILSIFLMWFFYNVFAGKFFFANQLMHINDFIWIIKIALLLLSFFVILLSNNYGGGNNKLEFTGLILLSLLGMFFVISSNDFFFLYLSIELMSLPIYILLGSKKSIISIESSVKYFILGSIISVFMLLGVSLIYGYFGVTNYYDLRDLLILQSSNLNFEVAFVLFSFLLILITFFFKLGLAPFHFWVTDLYEGASLTAVFFITLVPKLAVLIAFYQLFIIIFGNLAIVNFYIYEFFFFIGLFSVFIGSWGGLKEIKLMRLLGQSSIVNMGFFFLIITTAQFEGDLIFFFIYAIYSFLLIQFFTILTILGKKIKNIVQLSGFFNYSFFFLIIASFCVLSFAAIPPLSGFLIKFYIFDVMINVSLFSPVFFLLLHSIVSAVFYIRLLYFIWQNTQWSAFFFTQISLIQAVILIFFFLLNALIIFFQDPMLTFFARLLISNI